MSLKRQVLILILLVLVFINFLMLYRSDFDRQLPDPVPLVTESFHKDSNDESWILKVENDGSVWVQMVDDKTNIHFRPSPGHLHLFSEHINNIADVTFECGRKPEEECDLSKPYKLYVNNVQVELLEIRNKKTAK
ncbi:MAG: hypothetical protein A3B86_00700 [Candidatus Yanofskybacteria bacterium RIFCSPHIGHO2_02_FULL_38_22b]|uniref:Uncharacterized protein n=1 Tax=Candidatus Yanofskybacteria bacterium RIFCSPHIGHO2_02_FULL_38_22b TaxID=1802673 RepID=A0A1F8F5Q4_9BACT|nr:MAG: hypothetical protein A2816_03565 [Candidatus Yanofskybacteria bacterium RIFCSPHIGHO2_01_FULL_39_44]OGN07599.1 MAG: hypothetical protein A3B86_00700 [Candidatus Yanofskybacteria bacterium RIFCSPHIGHO2_02_FULL_38_22b]OGN20228.1 MAG: hypothetical protein A2910_00235 [Candidatus Yanofskybacteria bacterium RIFCSPLOWO2_01_FULL_39_28]